MNLVLKQDLEEIVNSTLIDWNQLKNKTIFITGATGLIGSIIVKSILLKNEKDNTNIKMILVVRDEEGAKLQFGDNDKIEYIVSSIEKYVPKDIHIDYIFHGASPTKSKFFIEKPVETNDIAIIGTKNILEQAIISKPESMVYLSSMEMYGIIDSENVTEDMQGYIDPLNERSSYSQGKRTCELYNYCYFKEYGVQTKIARIAQTFGAGISEKENRVYKVFADSILDKKDIVLNSEGSTIINFSYTTDTVIALFCILLNGKSGEAYNVVSEKTDMTILDSAKWLSQTYGEGIVNVSVEIPNTSTGFAPNNKMILSNKKLKSIGWNPKYDIKEGYDRLLMYMKSKREEKC